MVSFVSLLAQRWILLNWKQRTAPTHSNLMNDVMKHFELEKIKLSLKKNKKRNLTKFGSLLQTTSIISNFPTRVKMIS